jgi:hypothetical protein
MKKIPLSATNIYPVNIENVTALCNYYLSDVPSDSITENQISILINNNISLIELEYITEKTVIFLPYLKDKLSFMGYNHSNILSYVTEIFLILDGHILKISKNRQLIINHLISKMGFENVLQEC